MLGTFTFVNTEQIRGARSTIRCAPYSTRGSTGARLDTSVVVVHEVIKLVESGKQLLAFHRGRWRLTSKTEGFNKSTLSMCSVFVSPVTLKSI